MRISTVQAFNNGVAGLQNNYSNVTRTQEEISTGKKILTPADDPVASVRLLQLGQEEALNAQYKTGMTAAKNALSSEDVILSSITGNVLQRIKEIAVQAGNGALDSNDRAALATELKQREDELLNLLNSKDANGKYLFSGSMGDTQPFMRNADGTYSYQGDEGQRNVQIASSTFLPVSDSGKAIFENIENVNRVKTTQSTLPDSTARISTALVTDKAAYDQKFPAPNDYQMSIVFTSAQNYEIRNAAGDVRGTGSVDTDSTTTDVVKFGGIEMRLDGTPQAGDTFTFATDRQSENKSLLNVVSDLRKALETGGDTPESGLVIRDQTAIALSNLEKVSAKILSVQGQVGARLNTIDTTETFIDDVSLVNKSVKSELEDLDYAEALSRMALQSTVLQAAQQSYVKINSLSLFNYL
ncbi:flagellar hook-associated protein FlgL [Pseudomonas matsuisoli]|uniref:Flagellar hook-associated protein FlgL n=1 Tax=Pseudomonas matsuisoli TaxID=1515666 RepID=A0A917PIH1_9PSED|nr:flagellar hook-associated protein FlgL [Pseudomonas matsuisoli]GGJ80535.1 flagellar hook-associated protein FlgL [Pseudomonas matsuisoli]